MPNLQDLLAELRDQLPDTDGALARIHQNELANPDSSGGAGSVSLSEFALAGSVSAGGTTISITNPTKLYNGAVIAVGAFTTSCEIRRVTGISGSNVTLGTALALSHSNGENVIVLNSTWVTPEWFGCKPGDSTFDSYPGLIQALMDMARTSSPLFGLTGHGQRYYTSRPLAFPQSSQIQNIVFTAFSSFGIDPTVGKRAPGTNETTPGPDQYLAVVAQSMPTVTSVDTAANTITLSAAPAVGNRLLFYPVGGSTLPAPLEAGRSYFVVSSAANVVQIATDWGGSAIDITDVGSGSFVAFYPGFSRIYWQRVTLEGQAKQGLNGLYFVSQQPSTAITLRIDGFPGPQGGIVISGQQSDIYELEIINCSVGIRPAGMEFLHIYGYNLESCDRHMVVENTETRTGILAGNEDIVLSGGHWESLGQYSNLTQTIVGNASVTAGTFTLSFNGETTSALAYNANAAAIQAALEALTSIVPGDVVCTDLSGGLAAGGSCQIQFGGQYAWKALSGTQKTTVASAGLTGGTYSMSYMAAGARNLSIKGSTKGLFVSGALVANTGQDFLVLESSASTLDGYSLQSITTTGQTGNFVNDVPRGITVPISDNAGGGAERLGYFQAPGYHGGTVAKNFWLAGTFGAHAVWDEYSGEWRLNAGAKLRYGDTGPVDLIGTGSPEGVVTAPVASTYRRTDGGTNTALYRKESGTGNTGWVAVTNPASSGASFPAKYKTGRYYVAPSSSRDSTADGAMAPTLNQLLLVPFAVGETMPIDRIGCSVTTAAASAVVRLGVYSDTDGLPDALLFDAGTIDASTTGYKELTITQTLAAGSLYWVAICLQGATGVQLRAVNIGCGAEWVGADALSGDSRQANYLQSSVSGAFPANATPANGQVQSPLIKLRAA